MGLLLSQSKTQVMFIKPRGVLVVPGIVNCRGAPLVNVSSVKYLGVLIDDDLRWVSHIQHTAVKYQQAIEQLWHHRRCLNHAARRMWYVAMVQSKLCYGSNAIFPSLLERGKATISKLSKAGVRAVFGLHNPASTQPLLNELHVSENTDIMFRKVLIFVYRWLNAQASLLFAHYYTPIASLTDGNHRLTRGQEARLLSVSGGICFAFTFCWHLQGAHKKYKNVRTVFLQQNLTCNKPWEKYTVQTTTIHKCS